MKIHRNIGLETRIFFKDKDSLYWWKDKRKSLEIVLVMFKGEWVRNIDLIQVKGTKRGKGQKWH